MGVSSSFMSLGSDHTCVIIDFKPYCFGYDLYGELGGGLSPNNSNPAIHPSQWGSSSSAMVPWYEPPTEPFPLAIHVTAGYHSTCVTFANQKTRCCGLHGNRRNGTGSARSTVTDAMCKTRDPGDATHNPWVTALPSLTPFEVVEIDNGEFATCELRANGLVRCWGSGTYGLVGSTKPPSVKACVDPTGLTCSNGFGFQPFEAPGGADMGDLPWNTLSVDEVSSVVPLDFGTTYPALELAVANRHACAVIANGQARCWGMNAYSGGSKSASTMAGTAIVGKGTTADFTLHSLVRFQGSADIISVAVGGTHTCFMWVSGPPTPKLTCFGYNPYGQLGTGNRVDCINNNTGQNFLDNALSACAATLVAPAGSPVADPSPLWASVTAGADHTCALTVLGRVHCWGRAHLGQLGSGSTADVLSVPGAYVLFNDPGPAVALFSGVHHNCAVFGAVGDPTSASPGRRIRCWGAGFTYRLGRADVLNVGDSAGRSVFAFSNPVVLPAALSPGRIRYWALTPRAVPPGTAGISVTLRGPELMVASVGAVRLTTAANPAFTATVSALTSLGRRAKVFTFPSWPAPAPAGTYTDATVEFGPTAAGPWEDTGHTVRIYDPQGTPTLVFPRSVGVAGNASLNFSYPAAVPVKDLTMPTCFFSGSASPYAVAATISASGDFICSNINPEPAPKNMSFTVSLGAGFPSVGPFTVAVLNVTLTSTNLRVGLVSGGTPFKVYGTGLANVGDPAELVFFVSVLGNPGQRRSPIAYSPDATHMVTTLPNFKQIPEIEPYKQYLWAFLPVKVILALSFDGSSTTNFLQHYVFDNPKIGLLSPASSPISPAFQTSIDLTGENLFNLYDNTSSNAAQAAWAQYSIAPIADDVRPRVRFVYNGTNSSTSPAPMFVWCTWVTNGKMRFSAPRVARENAGRWLVDFSYNDISWSNLPYPFYFFYVQSIFPTAGPNQGPRTTVTVRGVGFIPDAQISCRSSMLASSVVAALYFSPTMVTCPTAVISPSLIGTGGLSSPFSVSTIASSLGIYSDAVAEKTMFTFYLVPTVTAVNPKAGPSGVSTTITLFSPSFENVTALMPAVSPRPVCQIDGVNSVGTLVSTVPGVITCPTPPMTKTAIDFDISLSLNTFDFSVLPCCSLRYRYITVYSADPAIGPSTGGTDLIISGSGFLTSMTPTTTCMLGAASGTGYISGSATAHCSAPPNAPGTYQVLFSVSSPPSRTTEPVFFTYYAAPVITAVVPTSGSAGVTLCTLFGTNFAPVAGMKVLVRFGADSVAKPTALALPGPIVVTVPLATAPGVSAIVVSFNNGADYSPPDLVNAAFYVFTASSILPALGPAAGGSVVAVSGIGYVSTGSIQCRFGGAVVAAAYQRATQISCPAPPAGPGPVPFAVSLNAGLTWSTTAITFSYYQGPVITALVPEGGPSAGGTVVTLYGSNFVLQGGLPVSCRFSLLASPAAAIVTATAMTCTSPPSSGSAPVEVSLNGGFDYSNSGKLYGFFALADILPSFGPAGGGTQLAVSGSGFVIGASSSTCRFGAVASPATVISLLSAQCVVPPLVGGVDYSTDIAMSAGVYTGVPRKFYAYATPTVTALSPSSGPGPKQSVSVTVYGTNFDVIALPRGLKALPGCLFDFVRMPADEWNPTLGYVVCQSPSTSAGSDAVEVTFNARDYTSQGLLFFYYSITSIEPAQAPLSGGTSIMINGAGFSPTAVASCLFGQTVVPALYLSPAQMRCLAPPGGAPGSVTFEFRNEGSSATQSGQMFTYFALPTVVSVVPRGGSALGGSMVTVSGTNFKALAGVCRFGQSTVPATPAVVPATGAVNFECRSPAGNGVVNVEVSLNAGFDFTSDQREYHYFFVLALTPVLGPSLTPGLPNTVVTLTGGGFTKVLFPPTHQAVCRFGPTLTSATLTFVDAVRIACVVPASVTPGVVDVQLYIPPITNGTDVLEEVSSGSFGLSYTYYKQPAVTGFFPQAGPVTGGAVVSVWGTSFFAGPTTLVQFGGSLFFQGRVTNASVLDFTSAASTASEVTLLLTFNRQQFLTIGTFRTYSLISIYPPLGPVAGGTVVEIRGTGFYQGSFFPSCMFGNAVVRGTILSQTMMTCIAPPLADAQSGAFSAVPLPPPTAAGNATAAGNTTAAAGNTTTTAAAAAAPPVTTTTNGTANGTALPRFSARQTAAVAAQTTLPVKVSTSGLHFTGVAAGAAVDYLYHTPPTILSLDPLEGWSSGNTTVVILGVNLGPARRVPSCLFGDPQTDSEYSAVPAVASSDTHVVCVSPAHTATTVPVKVSLNSQQYGPSPLVYNYKDCLPGFFAPTFRDICLPCEPGSAAPDRGSRRCTPCDSSFYATSAAMVLCEACPRSTFISDRNRTSLAQCECKPEYFEPNGLNGKDCFPCPVGAVCDGGTLLPVAQAGSWLSPPPSALGRRAAADYIFLACDNPPACTGGRDTVDGCAKGYLGRLCTLCQKGYYKVKGMCAKCPPGHFMNLVVAAVVLVGACALLFRMVGPEVSAYGGTINITVYFLQVVGILFKLDLHWPQSLITATSYAGFLIIDVDVLGPQCSAPTITFQQVWLFKMLFPLMFLLIFLIIFAMTYVSSMLRKRDEIVHDKNASKLGQMIDVLINVYLLILSLNYLFLVTTSFQLFDCTMRADGSFTLDAQPNLICYDPWWYKLLPVGLAGILLYAISIPVVFAVLMQRNKHRLDEPRVIGRIGSCYIDYVPEKSYYEAVSMMEKLGIATTLTFFTTFVDVQIIAFLLVTVMGLAGHIIAQPFFISRYNRLQTLLRWCSCLMIMSGMIFRAGNFPGVFVQYVVTAFVFLIIIFSVILVVGIIVYDVLMIKRSLNSDLGGEVTKFIVTLTTPQGKTDLMEWMGTGVDKALLEDFSLVFTALGRFYLRVLDEGDNCELFDKEGWVEGNDGSGGGGGGGEERSTGGGGGGGGDITTVEDDGGDAIDVPVRGTSSLGGRRSAVVATTSSVGGGAGGEFAVSHAAGRRTGLVAGNMMMDQEMTEMAAKSRQRRVGGAGIVSSDDSSSDSDGVDEYMGPHPSWDVPAGVDASSYVGSIVIRQFTRRTFLTPVNTVIQLWLVRMMNAAGVEGASTKESRTAQRLLKAFITLFTEVLRFSFYSDLGIKSLYRQSSMKMQIPWLVALKQEGDSDHELDEDQARLRRSRKAYRKEWWWQSVKEVRDDDRLTVFIRNTRKEREEMARLEGNAQMNAKDANYADRMAKLAADKEKKIEALKKQKQDEKDAQRGQSAQARKANAGQGQSQNQTEADSDDSDGSDSESS